MEKIDLATFKAIVEASQLSTENKTAAYRVLVLGHAMTAVAERMGMPTSRVSRACTSVLAKRVAPGRRYASGAQAFAQWFSDRLEAAPPVLSASGFVQLPSLSAAELRADLKKYAPDVTFGPSQFGEAMRAAGVQAARDGSRTSYMGVRWRTGSVEGVRTEKPPVPVPAVVRPAMVPAPAPALKMPPPPSYDSPIDSFSATPVPARFGFVQNKKSD